MLKLFFYYIIYAIRYDFSIKTTSLCTFNWCSQTFSYHYHHDNTSVFLAITMTTLVVFLVFREVSVSVLTVIVNTDRGVWVSWSTPPCSASQTESPPSCFQ